MRGTGSATARLPIAAALEELAALDPEELEVERAVIALTWRPRRLPYGYRMAHRGIRVPVIELHEATVVRLIFQLFGQSGSIAHVRRMLDSLGHAAPRGGRWSRTSVRDILTNPAYDGRPRGAKPSPQKACIPIVSSADFQAAQRILRSRRRPSFGVVWQALAGPAAGTGQKP